MFAIFVHSLLDAVATLGAGFEGVALEMS